MTGSELGEIVEFEDGTPADPPTLHTAVPNWQAGHTIPLGPASGTLHVVVVRPATDPEDDLVLVVTPA
jgi:hypothetical protein